MKRYFILLTMLFLAGCGITSPFKAAETTSQKAYAVTATYNVVLESARDIVVDETVSIDLRRAVQRVEARTTPVIDELEKALALYLAERIKFDNAQSTEERLDVVSANLLTWLDQGELALLDLLNAIEGN